MNVSKTPIAYGIPANDKVDIQLVCKYKLDKQIAAQSKAFFIGLSDLLDSKCGFITVWENLVLIKA